MIHSPNRNSRRRTVASLLLACFIAAFASVLNVSSALARMESPIPYPQIEDGWPNEDDPGRLYLAESEEAQGLSEPEAGPTVPAPTEGATRPIALLVHRYLIWLFAWGVR